MERGQVDVLAEIFNYVFWMFVWNSSDVLITYDSSLSFAFRNLKSSFRFYLEIANKSHL